MNSENIHAALKDLFGAGGHETVYLKEFRAGTGFGAFAERYLDAWIMDTFPSSGLTKTAIEIKVSRSDFTREKRSPMKRDSALRISNHFYFAAPKGMLSESDIPDECGLIEIEREFPEGKEGEFFKAEIVVRAPYRECPTASWVFLASIARRAAKSP